MRRDTTLAYYVAAFTRAKTLGRLETYLRKLTPTTGLRPQTLQQMEAAAKQWTRHLGGTIRKEGGKV